MNAPRQAGIALLAVIVAIGIAAAVLVVRGLDAGALGARQNQRTAEALQAAREALLAYAATDANRPGSLPCPDIDGDGRALPGIEYVGNGCQSYIGRLPWALLRIPELRDGSGERLWYALSPGFRDAGPATGNPGHVNPDTPATLTIEGLPGTFGAIVLAPGASLQGQLRSGPGASAPGNYLDGRNAAPSTVFSAALPGPAFNDRLLPVSGADLLSIAERRVALETVAALNDYFEQYGFVPFAAPFSDARCFSPDFVPPNGCQPVPGVLAGRIPGSVPGHDYAPVLSARPSALLRGESVAAERYHRVWFQLQRWREHVVYIVSPECAGPPAQHCPAGSINLRGAGRDVDNARFALLMAGPAEAGQSRASAADKSLVANYLEAGALSAALVLASSSLPAQVIVPSRTVAAAPRHD
jgi:hypothetical protein